MFKKKTLDVMSRLSLQEQKYLYRKTEEFKDFFLKGNEKVLNTYRISNKDFGIYEVFMENSTRTKESFKNALDFHQVKSNILDVEHSSFSKKESYADAFNMLTGYNNQLFIIRSKLEGVCTWLGQSTAEYAKRQQLPVPGFINAGDGKHEHPTQEMLDQFSFLEQYGGDVSSIHIALIGDLLHGRTIHSKVSGLAIYDKVVVDLIAPEILSLPERYIERMKQQGYTINIFDSLDTYLAKKEVADIWYFTRIQLERMGEDVLRQESRLRKSVTCTEHHIDVLEQLDTQKKVMFYHPLPRHKEKPVIPHFLDTSRFNGRENQARNGFFVRVVLLGALAGVGTIVDGFDSENSSSNDSEEVFIQEVATGKKKQSKNFSEGMNPILNGISIDHISKGQDIGRIKKHLQKIVSILGLFTKGGEWISTGSDGLYKGIIFRPNSDINDTQIRKLAALAPGCTLNRIVQGEVTQKMRLSMPPKLYGFEQISCKNELCISHPKHNENMGAEFTRNTQDLFACDYCGHTYVYDEIRDV